MKTRERLNWILFCYFFIYFNEALAENRRTTINVSPIGTHHLSCGSDGKPCKTLDLALQTAINRGMNFTQILLKQGNYELKNAFAFTWAENISIVGESDQVAIKCSSNVSLAFLLSENIEFKNLKFMECGSWQKSVIGSKSSSGDLNYMEYRTALYFSYVKNLRVSNVQVLRSYGVGLTLNDVGGNVFISSSKFIDNIPRQRHNVKLNNRSSPNNPEEHKQAHTGGGIFLLLNSFGYSVINITREKHDTYQHNNRYMFTDLVFRGNEAESPGFQVTMNTPLVPFSRGGGVGVYLFGNASGNAFTLSRCEFVGNRAQWGGGLQVEFKHLTQSNTIRVQDSIFKENYASFAGGGARFGDLTISKQALQANKFYFDHCQFFNNTSIWGGGSSMYGTTFTGPTGSHSNRQKFVLNHCHWQNNKGNVGSAVGVFLFNLNDDTIGPYQSVHVTLENCIVTNNEVIIQEENILIGQGAFYTVEVPIIFKGNISIANNTNTGMVLDSAMAVIDGQVEFRHNTGYSGGGLALYGNSRIKFNKKSKLVFVGNQCVEKGGAMYINAPGPPQVSFNATGYNTHQCFFDYVEQSIDYDKWETEILFQNNRAPNEESGRSVYATTLQNCRRVGEKRKNNTVLQWNIVTFLDASGKNRTSVNREVSTDPLNIAFEKDDWIVGASEYFNATVALLDEKNNPVVGMVDVRTSKENSSSNVRLSTSSSLFLVNNKTIQHLSLAGKGGDRFSVILRSIGGRQLEKVITNLTLKKCNPGFHNQEDRCVCSNTILSGISRCGDDGKSVYLKRGYWAGVVDGHLRTAICPVNYCTCPDIFGSNLVGECTFIQNQMCSGNRDEGSVVCGKCKPGYTSAFASDDCVKNCSVFKILYFIPIAVGLSLLVMIIMVINVDVFTGYLNAWLYSYQVMTLITPGTHSFDGFMSFVIGLANFELSIGGTGICFTKGIDEADELMITYILPTYILVVVYFIAKAVRRWPNWRYSRKVKSPFSALCTLFVLCYTNITGISLRMLNPVRVGDKLQLFSQGELGFFQDKHIVYGVIAILFIFLVVAMVPFLLICQAFVTKFLRRIKINVSNLKPFFDKLQGCFKDEYRWCAAFYFLSRLLILILDTYVTHGPVKRALLEGACVLILTVFVYLRPYKEGKTGETSYDWINLSDAVLLTNLTVIAIFSSVIEESPFRSTREGVGAFVNVLAYVPLIVLVAVLYKAFKQYSDTRKKEGNPLKMRFSQLLSNRNDGRSQIRESSDNQFSENLTSTAGYVIGY